jgi:hypothetical protein
MKGIVIRVFMSLGILAAAVMISPPTAEATCPNNACVPFGSGWICDYGAYTRCSGPIDLCEDPPCDSQACIDYPC